MYTYDVVVAEFLCFKDNIAQVFNADLLSITTFGAGSSAIEIKMHEIMHTNMKMSSVRFWRFCFGLNMLRAPWLLAMTSHRQIIPMKLDWSAQVFKFQ